MRLTGDTYYIKISKVKGQQLQRLAIYVIKVNLEMSAVIFFNIQ